MSNPKADRSDCRITRPLVRLLCLSAVGVLAVSSSCLADGAKQMAPKGGLFIHVGCGDGRHTVALAENPSCLVHGLDTDAAEVAKARELIRSKGLYGRVSVEHWSGPHLPYADNLVNFMVVEESSEELSREEILRVLAPKGTAFLLEGDTPTKIVKPWPEAMDDWTHYLHDAGNNAVADDSLVGPPKHLQWVCGPKYARSHEIDTTVSALVSAAGRLFYILDEGLTGITDPRLPQQWALVARDAFNGVRLWKRPLPDWGWPKWKKEQLEGKDWTTLRGQRTRSPLVIPRRLVSDGQRVYVTLGFDARLSILDAETGKTLRTVEGTDHTDEILFFNGTVLLCLREDPDASGKRRGGTGTPDVLARVDPTMGRILWKKQAGRVLPLTLAAEEGRVFCHDGQAVVARDVRNGEELWRAPKKAGGAGMWRTNCTLVAHKDLVFCFAAGELVAIDAAEGKVLWKAKGRGGPAPSNPPDLFVADGRVWFGGPEGKHKKDSTRVLKSGLDPRTGEVKRVVDVPNLISPLHHFRCYRSKATERYLLWTKRGVEFIDVKGDDHMRHDWIRAACKYGFMPANGSIYIPSNQCFCYPGVRLTGFSSLTARRKIPGGSANPNRLEEGPAFGRIKAVTTQTEAAWPTYRHDAKRSGSTDCAVPPEVKPVWQAKLGGKLTQPVAMNGKLLVASVDEHCVICLDSSDGKILWRYTAGGRVDSPPTICGEAVLFGSADGWVYCLRAEDGKLAWRFRAAPTDCRIVSYGRLESAWPVHGSVLLKDGVAYCAAGRSSFLDGGIHLYGLDPKTGKVLHKGHVEGPYPDVQKDVGRPFDMDGTLADVLVTDVDGEFLYMRQAVFDSDLKQEKAPRITVMGDRKMGRHVMATAGLLDDNWWNRTFWMFTERWPGFYIANQSPKAGQLLVFDDESTYAVKCYTRRNRHSPMFFPGKEGYLLFADDNENEPMLYPGEGELKPMEWLPKLHRRQGWELDDPAKDRDKGPGFSRAKPTKWQQWVPIRIRAMVLAGNRLFVAGPPDVLEEGDPLAAFEGRKGAKLRVVSTKDGASLAECSLDAPPVFDGMIAAGGRLFVTLRDGRVVCMAGS